MSDRIWDRKCMLQMSSEHDVSFSSLYLKSGAISFKGKVCQAGLTRATCHMWCCYRQSALLQAVCKSDHGLGGQDSFAPCRNQECWESRR